MHMWVVLAYQMSEQTRAHAQHCFGYRDALVSSAPRIVPLGPKDRSRGTDNPGRMNPFFFDGMTVGFDWRAAGGGPLDRRRNIDASSSAMAR
jgi:hypothetical protein